MTMLAIRLSAHARLRQVEMGITDDELEALVNFPDFTAPADARHGLGRTTHKRGAHSSILGGDGTVITLLWSGEHTRYEAWSRSGSVGSMGRFGKRVDAC